MERSVLESIAARIRNDSVSAGSIVLGKEGYEPAELSAENFRQIPDIQGAVSAFVDGGNAELAKGANFSLQFIRTCAVVFENCRRKSIEREEALCLVQAVKKEGSLKYEIELFGIEGLNFPAVDIYEASLSEGGSKVEPARVAELVRSVAEIRLAAKIITQLPANSFLILDGDLQAKTLYEQNALRQAFENARLRGVTVAGLSKTNSLLTNTGHSAVPLLLSIAPELSWYYHPVAVSSRQDHQAAVSIAKLHPKSRHAFRIDIWDQQEALLPQLVAVLSVQSRDAAFLGYPYGLVEADRFARVREEEKAYLRTKAEIVIGETLFRESVAKDGHEHLNRAV